MDNSANEAAGKWFREARFGLFVHWGITALAGRGDWAMQRDGIPAGEYARLAERFDPRAFSTDHWCRLAADAGMKYAVMVAKHNDGFALFDSAADSFNSARATPARRDFVAEYVASCRKYGLGAGLYFSLNDWRYALSGRAPEDYGPPMRELAHAQVRELLSNYGKIDILWYDGAACPGVLRPTAGDVAGFWHSGKLDEMVRGLQPGILVNNRSGLPGDFRDIEGQNIIRPPENVELWEACFTLGDDDFSYWSYLRDAVFQRTPAQALLLLLHTLEHGGNCLLNVGPDPDGIIPAWQQNILALAGCWVRNNREAVYQIEKTEVARTSPISLQGNSCGFFTAASASSGREGILYFYLYGWPGRGTRVPYLRKKVNAVSLLVGGAPLEFHQEKDGALTISGLPEHAPDPFCTVLKLETEGDI